MARLTDNNGVLLGGLETPLSHLLPPLNETQAAAITAPAALPSPPKYEPGEIVFALHCAYGSLTYRGYFAAPAPQTAGAERESEGRRSPRHQGCDTLIEEPEERRRCPACGGDYCLAHAEPAAHECRSVRRTN